MSPQENFNFINSYLSQVSPVIRQHKGFIDKYIGDAIMALFPDSANDAVQAAIAMQKQVALYNEQRQQQCDRSYRYRNWLAYRQFNARNHRRIRTHGNHRHC